MTLIGAVTLDWDSAICWADTEIYSRGEPAGRCNKLIVSPVAGIIGAGTGDSSIMEVGDRAVLDAEDIDDLVKFLPGRLLRAVAKATDHSTLRPADLLRNTYFVVGFSRAAGRVLVHIFDAWGMFEPRLATRAASPAVEFSACDITTFASVVPIARAQMAIMRQTCPKAAGTLCVAHLGPAGITAAPIYDFASEQPIPPRASAEIPHLDVVLRVEVDAEDGAWRGRSASSEAHPDLEKVL